MAAAKVFLALVLILAVQVEQLQVAQQTRLVAVVGQVPLMAAALELQGLAVTPQRALMPLYLVVQAVPEPPLSQMLLVLLVAYRALAAAALSAILAVNFHKDMAAVVVVARATRVSRLRWLHLRRALYLQLPLVQAALGL